MFRVVRTSALTSGSTQMGTRVNVGITFHLRSGKRGNCKEESRLRTERVHSCKEVSVPPPVCVCVCAQVMVDACGASAKAEAEKVDKTVIEFESEANRSL